MALLGVSWARVQEKMMGLTLHNTLFFAVPLSLFFDDILGTIFSECATITSTAFLLVADVSTTPSLGPMVL